MLPPGAYLGAGTQQDSKYHNRNALLGALSEILHSGQLMSTITLGHLFFLRLHRLPRFEQLAQELELSQYVILNCLVIGE